MAINTRKYIENCLKIRTKDSRVVPLVLNSPQLKLYKLIGELASQNKPIRIIILKARQMGFSTLTEAIIFKKTATAKNVKSGIVAHTDSATNNLFEMSKFFYNNLPPELKPMQKLSNAREVVFDSATQGQGLGSKISCSTAGGKGVGRSDTYQNLHISEYAFWTGDKEKTLLGLLQAVPNTKDSMVIIESTANGYDDFQKRWADAVAGESDYVPFFVGWNELEEYSMPYTGFDLTEEERRLKELYSVTNEQLTWRRWCIKNNCGGDVQMFKQEYPINPTEAFISTGECVFDKEAIVKRTETIPKPIKCGRFIYTKQLAIVDNLEKIVLTDIQFVEDSGGVIKIFDEPQQGVPYVIGGDTKGLGTDNYVGQVLDNTTGKQVAVYCENRTDDDLYAEQMYCLGKYYNEAVVGIETNFSLAPTRHLVKLGYENLYVRERLDTMLNRLVKEFGFLTSTSTRPVAISELIAAVREDINIVNDRQTLEEMLTFVRGSDGKPQAMLGKHDDRVMALAIAHQVRKQQDYTVKAEEKPKTQRERDFEWIFGSTATEEDEWGDYDRW